MSGETPISVRCRLNIENGLFSYGKQLGRAPVVSLLFMFLTQVMVIALWMVVYRDDLVPIETKIPKLWIESGGRVEAENNYVEDHREDGWDKKYNLILFTRKDNPAETILTKNALQDLLEVAKATLDIQVTLLQNESETLDRDITFSLNGFMNGINEIYNLCDYVPFPKDMIPPGSDALVATLTPCNRATLLDCFVEGGYDFYLTKFLLQQLWAVDGLVDNYGIVGYEDRTGLEPYTDHPEAFSPLPSIEDITDEDVLDIVKKGCDGYITKSMHWDIFQLFGGYDLNAEGDEIVSATAFQHVVVLASTKQLELKFKQDGITADQIEKLQLDWSEKLERMIVGLNEEPGRLKQTRVEIVAAGAFDRSMAEISGANGALIGIGYVLMACFVGASQFSKDPARNTVFVGLLGLAWVFMGNVFGLSLIVLAGVKLNAAVMQVLPFVALGLGVDDMFVMLSVYKEALRTNPEMPPRTTVGYMLREGGISVTLTSICNAAAFALGSAIPLPAVQVFCISAFTAVVVNYITLVVVIPSMLAVQLKWLRSGKVGDESIAIEERTTNAYTQVQKGFLHSFYIPMLSKLPVRILGCLMFVLFTGTGVALAMNVENGLAIIDVVPKDSNIYRGVAIIEEKFPISPAVVATKDLPYHDLEVIEALKTMMEDMQTELDFVVGADAGWVKAYEPHWKWRLANNVTAAGNPAESFKDFFADFRHKDNLTYVDVYINEMNKFGYNDDGFIDYAEMSFSIVGADSTDKMIDALEKTREFLAKHCGEDKVIKECFPSGTIFSYMEQYVGLGKNFYKAVLLCEIAIFLCCVVLLMNVLVGLFVSLLSVAVIMQIYGCLYIASIKFSAIPAVSLIMTLGIAVEFTAHLCVHFEAAIGNRIERMSEALHHMFLPILEGGFSSFLGFFALAFSPFAFIQKYYFLIYFLVVCVGLINGLFFLPVILSFFGPVTNKKSEAIVRERQKSISVIPINSNSSSSLK